MYKRSDNWYKFIRFARSNETVFMVNLRENREALLYARTTQPQNIVWNFTYYKQKRFVSFKTQSGKLIKKSKCFSELKNTYQNKMICKQIYLLLFYKFVWLKAILLLTLSDNAKMSDLTSGTRIENG